MNFPASPSSPIPIGTVDQFGRVWDGISWRCPVGIPEAPQDGNPYGRQNMQWVRVISWSNGEAENITVDDTLTANIVNACNVNVSDTLTANNATIQALTVVQIIGDQGTLDVDGAANFAQGVAIYGCLSCTLSAYFCAAVNMAELQVAGDGLIAGTTHTANISVTSATSTAQFAGNVNIAGTLTVGGTPITSAALAPLIAQIEAKTRKPRKKNAAHKRRR